MPRSITLAVPLAAFAAVLTLMCSGFMLSKTGWQKSTRFHIEVGDFAGEASSLLDFMQGSSDDAYVPTAVVSAVSSSQGADAGSPPPASTAPPVAALAGFADSEYDGFFLYARDEPVPSHDPAYLRKLLKSLLGMAVLLKRTLVLPAALCKCRDANLTDCDGPPVAPFDCPLREALNADAWRTTSLVRIKPARFLARSPETLPEIVRCSHLRVLLPDGMDDSELTFALRQVRVRVRAQQHHGLSLVEHRHPERVDVLGPLELALHLALHLGRVQTQRRVVGHGLVAPDLLDSLHERRVPAEWCMVSGAWYVVRKWCMACGRVVGGRW